MCKDGHDKGKNGRDITEAEDIKKRWQEYTEELYQKDLDVPDNPHSVVADLESEVKWALETAERRRETKCKGDRESYRKLNADFQRITRGDKRAFLNEQCKDRRK